MRALQHKLQHMGSHVDDTMLGRVILTTVRNVFPTTVEILRSREPLPTLRQIIDRLLAKENEAQRVTATKRSEPDEDQVRYTNKTDNPKPWAKKPKVKCLYCHKIGHMAKECRFKKRDLAKGILSLFGPGTEFDLDIQFW
jgi:hypothetical protein